MNDGCIVSAILDTSKSDIFATHQHRPIFENLGRKLWPANNKIQTCVQIRDPLRIYLFIWQSWSNKHKKFIFIKFAVLLMSIWV